MSNGTTNEEPRELRGQFVLSSLSALLTGLVFLMIPAELPITVGPTWLPLAIEGVIVLPLFYSAFVEPLPKRMARWLKLSLQGVLIAALTTSIVLLLFNLPKVISGRELLRPAVVLWVNNVLIFAGLYWEIDGGGPLGRHKRGHVAADFLFPQQQNGQSWRAGFIDYLFLSFCFSTALSPADTMPLTQRTKLLMMAEASIALVILVLLVSRSVNIL